MSVRANEAWQAHPYFSAATLQMLHDAVASRPGWSKSTYLLPAGMFSNRQLRMPFSRSQNAIEETICRRNIPPRRAARALQIKMDHFAALCVLAERLSSREMLAAVARLEECPVAERRSSTDVTCECGRERTPSKSQRPGRVNRHARPLRPVCRVAGDGGFSDGRRSAPLKPPHQRSRSPTGRDQTGRCTPRASAVRRRKTTLTRQRQGCPESLIGVRSAIH